MAESAIGSAIIATLAEAVVLNDGDADVVGEPTDDCVAEAEFVTVDESEGESEGEGEAEREFDLDREAVEEGELVVVASADLEGVAELVAKLVGLKIGEPAPAAIEYTSSANSARL